jgi:hypothetical protein
LNATHDTLENITEGPETRSMSRFTHIALKIQKEKCIEKHVTIHTYRTQNSKRKMYFWISVEFEILEVDTSKGTYQVETNPSVQIMETSIGAT